MPKERKEDLVMDCDLSQHSTLPSPITGSADLESVGVQYPAPLQNVPDQNTPRTSVSLKNIVPEIEIKLESSDEEEEKFEKNAGCVYGPPKKSLELKLRRILSGSQETDSFVYSKFGRGHAEEEETSRMVNDTPSPSTVRPTRKRKSTSEVWQFFYRDATNICRAICSLCSMSVSRGKLGRNFGTTALKRHLESKHPMEWAQRKSMRLQRAEAEEEEEDAFEDEEEKEEPYYKVFNAQRALYSSQTTSQSQTSSLTHEFPKTYEIIDSSDDGEEEDKGKSETVPLNLVEETDRKRMRILAENQSEAINQCPNFTTDTRDPDRSSMDGLTTQNSNSFTFNLPSYPLVPPGTKRRKSTSAVWQFFYIDCTNICRAICTLCQTSVSRGKKGGHYGTSALMRHLEGKHPLEWGRGKTNKPKSTSLAEAEEEEEEETDDQLDQIYPQSHISFGPLGSQPNFTPYSDLANSITLPVNLLPLDYDNESEETIKNKRSDCAAVTVSSLIDKHTTSVSSDLNASGKYTPNHPMAQSWNRNIAELMCGMGLPYSFINSKAFKKFMARADPRYYVPPRSFFSGKAVPQLYEAVCEKVVSELKRTECPHVHLSAHVWSSGLAMDYLALTAHWAVSNSDAPHSSKRKYAVLCIKSFPKDYTDVVIQQELIRQINLWLSPNALSPGFFVSSGDFNLVHAIKSANYIYIPCFTHSLNMLVMDFLQNNRYVTSMLGVARKVCSHFIHSARARRVLTELQYQNNLPKHPLKLETQHHWTSTFYMLQRLLEQQRAVQEYLGKYKLESAEILLTPNHWNLMCSLVDLLQPFEMATREVNANDSCLSQVLPEVRYLHIFLKQIRGHFESKGDVNGVVLADSFALKLSTDYGVNEMFQREEYVLSTLLDPRFKGRIEAILPSGSDIDHWKQVLVKKVKEIMSSSLYSPSQFCQKPASQFIKDSDSESDVLVGKHFDLEEGAMNQVLQWRRGVAAPPLIQKEKSLIEHLESVGLLASSSTGASLSTESHSACVMVEKYLQDNKTIGAKEDPLVYWEKRRWLWPALTKLAIMYLTCPPSSSFSERVFKSPRAFVEKQNLSDLMDGMEHIVFLKVNLENFPNYTPPPLIFSDNENEQSDSEDEI